MASAVFPDCRLSALKSVWVGPLKLDVRLPVMATVAEPPSSRIPTLGTMLHVRACREMIARSGVTATAVE